MADAQAFHWPDEWLDKFPNGADRAEARRLVFLWNSKELRLVDAETQRVRAILPKSVLGDPTLNIADLLVERLSMSASSLDLLRELQ